MTVAEFEALGIELLLDGRDSLRLRCARPVTDDEVSLIVAYKSSLLRELRAERRRQSRIRLAQGSEGECDVCKVHFQSGDWFRAHRGQVVHLECCGKWVQPSAATEAIVEKLVTVNGRRHELFAPEGKLVIAEFKEED